MSEDLNNVRILNRSQLSKREKRIIDLTLGYAWLVREHTGDQTKIYELIEKRLQDGTEIN